MGHAIHAFKTKQYQLNSIKSCPPEITEFAAMSMELLCMEHWDLVFQNTEECQMAKLQKLEKMVSILPWISQVDEFQHWVYTHQNATTEERKTHWEILSKEYKPEALEVNGCEQMIGASWQQQMHIFELPFYYIEYGIAQLGAIALWKNYRENPDQTIQRFNYALSLGYSKSVPDVYEAAGVSFDFSSTYVRSIIGFLKEEIEKTHFLMSVAEY